MDTVRGALQTSGRPLDADLRHVMENRFHHDFSRVRVHADEPAAEASRAVAATAFTFGNDIVFGKDRYSPKSLVGQNLLAHELVHVTQQSGRVPRPLSALRLGAINDEHEKHAVDVANSSVIPAIGEQLRVQPCIQRQVEPAQSSDQVISQNDDRDKYQCLGDLMESENWRYEATIDEFIDEQFSSETLGRISHALDQYRGQKVFANCTCCGEIVSSSVREAAPGLNFVTNYPPDLEDPHVQSLGERTIDVNGGRYIIEMHVRMNWGTTASCCV
ncbi:MAG: DUF4157 domain-containing protein [Acidobacteriota bacterium]|nr:DUF4157 domain-containing protein [Acidobacteriota bacterium]